MFSALIDSRSRWLVGSSSTRKLGFCSISRQKIKTRRFAAGERLVRLQRVVAAEQHLPEQPAQFLLRRLRIELSAAIRAMVTPCRIDSLGGPAQK